MAKLFSFLLRRSICRNVLFTVFLEITTVYKCASNQEICMINNRRNITYFQAHYAELPWNDARQKCNGLGSSLPIICDKSEQDGLTSFLKNHPGYLPEARTKNHTGYLQAWISAKKTNYDNWKWIDGQPFSKRGIISQDHDSYTHVVINSNGDYMAQNPQHKIYYLCQYTGPACNSGDVILASNRCFKPSVNDRTWIDARNQCLRNGGDLAILYDHDLVILRNSGKLYPNRSYWIGLRKYTWRWQNKDPTGDSGEEMKYFNWSNDPYSGECISIDESNGGWQAAICSESRRVVCQNYSHETTSSRPGSSKMTARMPIIASSKTSTTTSMTTSTTTSMTTSTTTSVTTSTTTSVTRPTSTTTSMTRSTPTTTSVTISTPTTTRMTRSTISSTMFSTATRAMLNTLENASKNATNAESHVLLYSGIGAGIAFIIICIIVIILVVRCTRKSKKDMNPSEIKNDSEQNRLDLSPNKPDSAPANASVAAADDLRGVYAEISLATLSQPELKSKIEQPGTVYADLDFQRKPTSLEPDKKSAYAASNPPNYAN